MQPVEHYHVSHSKTQLIQGGTGSSTFDPLNTLLITTANKSLIDLICIITALYITHVQIHVYRVGLCIVSSNMKQNYIYAFCPKN